MDNAARSERSRNAVLEAALAIIARDGPARLTLDAIAREGGLSKGRLMHQFPSKEAVLAALVKRLTEYSEAFYRAYMDEFGTGQPQPHLAAYIASLREATATPRSHVFAVLAAAAQEPGLMTVTRDIDAKKIKAIKAESSDPDLAILRWVAAWGLTLTALLGLSPLSEKERQRLFDRLLDDRLWGSTPKSPPPKSPAPNKSGRPRRAARRR